MRQNEQGESAMNEGIKTIIYPVKDITRAKALFSMFLGVSPDMDKPYYVGFTIGKQHVGLDPTGQSSGPIGFRHVDDIRGSLKALVDAGAEVLQEVKEVGGGRLIASAKDGEGNVLGFIQPGPGEHRA
jgi:predicted enzyme related to lactoylglutathione lyase